ncbi:MAG TPA: hypothetical protein VN086_01680 [Candidatus Paceibacterota bacterium]|nr:hypothetical protein [Candidatus Paceibacterota bacterium]
MNKRLKLLLSVLAFSVGIAAVYFFVMNPNMSSTSSQMATTTTETATSTASTTKAKPVVRTTPKPVPAGTTQTGTVAPRPTVIWSFTDKSNPRDTSALYTAVLVSTETDQHDLGVLPGICKTIPDTDLKGVGEISAIQCLNAGKGTEVGVFKQGSVYVLKSGSIVKGEAGAPDTRGTFSVIYTLK